MTNTDEKKRILKMVQEGKLSAQEAVQLLEALEPSPEEKSISSEIIPDPAVSSNGKAHWLKVVVTELSSGKRKVNLKIPLALARWGMKMGSKASIGGGAMEDLDLQSVLNDDILNDGQKGILVDVEDVEDGEHVVISLE
ncbi:MAG: hypothetical protein PHW11_09830 [Anaerolineaceae bacterium]|jgi:hypothetical protein|nr:hypothetical protein [Anaerolineaceae bacterium]MDD4043686.1 hypothetical protein [Anaerolineaceae bacterium]MDD4578059.1 hypothetical protein [Anaerolineaceae bacterium]